MKGKWAKGIPPRFFAWVIKDRLAVSERPGGYARNHRRVRRHEEILWLRAKALPASCRCCRRHTTCTPTTSWK